ncbi:MAG: nuclear transport factor 2 family protein [Burkholderiales bacterium]|nr:nuclear transport factor 2 family protein [Burkholderiales bacterium]
MRLARTSAALLVSSLLLACAAPPPKQDTQDRAALELVVETFRTSILRKDKLAFMSLFFSDKAELITWQAVVDDPSLRWIQRSRPEALKARYRPDNNFLSFIDVVVSTKSTEEERFSNVLIDTDGEVASISFDYVYFSDGRATNHGREKWLLVRTERGWKITSVVYTIRLPVATSGV